MLCFEPWPYFGLSYISVSQPFKTALTALPQLSFASAFRVSSWILSVVFIPEETLRGFLELILSLANSVLTLCPMSSVCPDWWLASWFSKAGMVIWAPHLLPGLAQKCQQVERPGSCRACLSCSPSLGDHCPYHHHRGFYMNSHAANESWLDCKGSTSVDGIMALIKEGLYTVQLSCPSTPCHVPALGTEWRCRYHSESREWPSPDIQAGLCLLWGFPDPGLYKSPFVFQCTWNTENYFK